MYDIRLEIFCVWPFSFAENLQNYYLDKDRRTYQSVWINRTNMNAKSYINRWPI